MPAAGGRFFDQVGLSTLGSLIAIATGLIVAGAWIEAGSFARMNQGERIRWEKLSF